MNKVPTVVQYFSDHSIDIAVLSETWQVCPIPGKMDPFPAAIKDFGESESLSLKSYCKARNDGRIGGGITLISRETLPFSYYNVNFGNPTSFEFLSLKSKCSSPVVVGCVYRPSSSSISVFLEEFRDLLSALNLLSLPSVLLGDFNIRMNYPNDSNTIAFCNLLWEFDFLPLLPTDATHRDGSTLDFVVAVRSVAARFSDLSVDVNAHGSDHFPVLFQFDSPERFHYSSQQPRVYRRFSSIDLESFKIDLEEKLSAMDESSTFGSYLHSYNSAISSVLELHAPLQQRVSRERRPNPPWMDREYIRERSLRKRLQSLPDKSRYNAQNRYCSYLSKKKRREYNQRNVATASKEGDQKKVYKALKKITGKNINGSQLPSISDPSVLANTFNTFFVNKVNNIRDSLPSPPASAFASDGQPSNSPSELSFFSPTDDDELRFLVKKHGIKTSTNDPMPAFLVEKHFNSLLPYLKKLVNLSLSTASFDGLKEAQVVPILKSFDLDVDELKNYRPVSLLPFVSKLTERIVHSRINDHLAANDLSNPRQYGYKKGHNCEFLLLKLIDDILVAVDKGSGVVMLIIDLSAAFDTVDHSVLLKILRQQYHITGMALDWIRAFLSGRTQRVKIGDVLSDSVILTFGVPQGSILGPLLFNLYCSSIDHAFNLAGFSSMGYADDNLGLRLFPAFSLYSTIRLDIPRCLSILNEWTNKHFLKLNCSKTQVMCFGTGDISFDSYRTNTGRLMPICKNTRLLGYHIDSELNMDFHVSQVVRTTNFMLRNLKHVRKFLDKSTAETLIHSLITNKIDANSSLYIGLSASNLNKLQRLQNDAMRVLLQLGSREPIALHIHNHHWLTIKKRIYYKHLTIVFKCLNNVAPVHLQNKLQIRCPLNMTLDINNFRPDTSFGRKSFSYLAPRLWNPLPRNLRVETSISTFKGLLKTFLFEHFDRYIAATNPYT